MSGHCYDHPVLWNEARKRWEEKRIADESIKEFYRKQNYKRIMETREREQCRKMMAEHNPWGKPGGGAPNPDVRISNIVSKYGLYPDGGIGDCRNVPPGLRYRPPRANGGGGAPIRTSSGRMLVPYRDDPILGFNDPTRNYVDIELRYKTSAKRKNNYKMQLDRLVEEKERDRIRKYKNSQQVDQTLDAMKDPWGRPGPGGNPWRPARMVGNKFMQSLGWTNKSDLQNLDYEPCSEHPDFKRKLRSPPSKINCYPQKLNNIREEDNVNISKNLHDKELNEKKSYVPMSSKQKCCTKCACVCLKEIISNENLYRNPGEHEMALNYNEPKQMNNMSENKPKSPKRSTTKNYLQKHRSKNCIVEPKARPCMITAGVELVPLLAKRRAQQDLRPFSLSTTDVTRFKDGKGDWKEYGSQYLDELNRQIVRRERDEKLMRERDVVTSQQHFDTWDTFWGRPGNGAPRSIKNKLNLNDLLYNVPLN